MTILEELKKTDTQVNWKLKRLDGEVIWKT